MTFEPQKILDQALAFHAESNFSEAEQLYKQVIKIVPDNVQILNNLGLVILEQGKTEEALEIFSTLAKKSPNDLSYRYNLAASYTKLGKLCEAAENFEKVIVGDSKNLAVLVSLSSIYVNLGNFEAAIDACKRVIELSPDSLTAYKNLVTAYRSSYQITEAIEAGEKLLELSKGSIEAKSTLLPLYQYACDWKKWGPLKEEVEEDARKKLACGDAISILPFDVITMSDDPEFCLQVTKAASEKYKQDAKTLNHKFEYAKKPDGEKITIGYISADFSEGVIGHQIRYMFAHHNKEEFSINLYSTSGSIAGECVEDIKSGCSKFLRCHEMSDLEIANNINSDKVDILVDITGYTSGQRPIVSALRPAPINVNYLGFTGTLGADFYDYIVCDKVVVPEEHQEYFSETCAYVPDTLQTENDKEKISEKDLSKKDFSTPEDAFVLGAYHQAYKIDPIIFEIWMDLLKNVDNSVLWLRACNLPSKENLKKCAKQYGVEPERIIFLDMIDRDLYYKRLSLIDLALDTRVYNGGSTVCDALWAGVPVISILGDHYASRMAAGIINGIGLFDDLVVDSKEDYYEKALHLSKNPEELRVIREKLWKNRKTKPLFNTERIVRHLESVYEQIWQRYEDGLEPDVIEVS